MSSLLALTVYEEVVGYFHAVPAVVAVHSVEAADDRSDHACALLAVRLYVFDEAQTAAGVGIAAVHEAVEIYFLEVVVLGNVAESVEVVE